MLIGYARVSKADSTRILSVPLTPFVLGSVLSGLAHRFAATPDWLHHPRAAPGVKLSRFRSGHQRVR